MTHDIGLMEKTEMYLKAIMVTQQSAPPVTTSKIADFLNITVPAASDMLKRLMQKGLVLTENDGGFGVTVEGQRIALRVIRRLRIAERFLTDVLGLSLEKVYDEACKFEHVLGGEVEERLGVCLRRPGSGARGGPRSLRPRGVFPLPIPGRRWCNSRRAHGRRSSLFPRRIGSCSCTWRNSACRLTSIFR